MRVKWLERAIAEVGEAAFEDDVFDFDQAGAPDADRLRFIGQVIAPDGQTAEMTADGATPELWDWLVARGIGTEATPEGEG